MIQVEQNLIHNAVWDWIYQGDNDVKELSFIAARYDSDGKIESDSSVVYTPEVLGTSQILKKYMRGMERVQYNLMITQYAPISTQTNSRSNIRVLETFERVSQWAIEQEALGIYPKFPENCIIEKIIVNPGTIGGVDKTGAKFQQIINIIYTKKGN